MKLKFDSGLDYQLEAIKSVTDLFEGLPEQLLTNVHTVQARNNVPESRSLDEMCSYPFSNF